MHRQARYRDRVYGHARRDRDGRLWLQYWLFYYYNDFQLLGPLVSGGKHEGDWELVQLRLGAAEQPEQAVFSQHKHAESRAWTDVRKAGTNTPLVYVARGSHANYFGAGSHWTGVWLDQADGKGPQITPTLEVLEDAHAGLGALARLVGGHEGDEPRRSTRRARAARAAGRTGSTRRAGAPRRGGPAPRRPRRSRRAPPVIARRDGAPGDRRWPYAQRPDGRGARASRSSTRRDVAVPDARHDVGTRSPTDDLGRVREARLPSAPSVSAANGEAHQGSGCESRRDRFASAGRGVDLDARHRRRSGTPPLCDRGRDRLREDRPRTVDSSTALRSTPPVASAAASRCCACPRRSR